MNKGTQKILGLIIAILGIFFVIKMFGGFIWVILIIIGGYLILKE